MNSTKRWLGGVVLGLAIAGCQSNEPRNEKMTLEQAPVAVRRGIDKAFPEAEIKRIEKQAYENGVVHYEVKLVTRYGHERTVEFATDGELLQKHDH